MFGTEREIGATTLPLHIDLIPYSCLCLALTQKTNLCFSLSKKRAKKKFPYKVEIDLVCNFQFKYNNKQKLLLHMCFVI